MFGGVGRRVLAQARRRVCGRRGRAVLGCRPGQGR